jgi:DEAD/DEAH box helicase domain-containing protein
MIPSVLSSQVRQGIEDFINTTFPVTNPFFHGVVERLLEEDGAVFKGPYLSIQLPYRTGSVGRNFFPDVPQKFDPYFHQEQAFERLGHKNPRSTIVATGTGSGKTECFLYPILDYCLRHRGEKGIKAIIIYPMNALAADQAGRLARSIFTNDKLRGQITAGLFVGEEEKAPRQTMYSEGIVTDKNTLRLMPPDILLTNYKMLDYLLIRQRDFALWQQNEPETLKFIVVDEIHTFDGAQGTDLACLLRRLKMRLSTPESYLCCVGTSATLGSRIEQAELKNYAESVFGETFDDDAIINEARLSTGEFLEAALISRVSVPPAVDGSKLMPEFYEEGYRGYIRGQHQLWFEEPLPDADFNGTGWREELVGRLKGHLFFHNLLKVLGGKILEYGEIIDELIKATPGLREAGREYCIHLLDSILALVSEARVSTDQPFLHVRLQFWLRELRRMVGGVSREPTLRFADDLTDEQRKEHLPVIHCRECGGMGWAGTKRHGDAVVNPDLQAFYSAFFNDAESVVFLFPGDDDSRDPQLEGETFRLCNKCLHLLAPRSVTCPSCDNKETIAVFVPRSTGTRRGRLVGLHSCPYCGTFNSLTILGSQAASLTSVCIGQIYSSGFNDDKKLLTFSDSVQDASHRAGFFGARTYRFTFRSALQKCIDALGGERTLAGLPEAFAEYWSRQMDKSSYIATFLSPDLAWFADYGYLRERGRLPETSRLLENVNLRVGWEIFSEYGFRSRIGRTLEKTGSSIAAIDTDLLDNLQEGLMESLQNEIGELRHLDTPTLRRFLLGLIVRLKDQGAVHHPGLEAFVENWGNTFLITRIPWMPNFGPRTRAPVFLTTAGKSRFDLVFNPTQITWYESWARKCFHPINPLVTPSIGYLYEIVLRSLVQTGIVEERSSKGRVIWGLNPASLRIGTGVTQFRCTTCGHNASIPESEAPCWSGSPCLRFHCDGHYEEEPGRAANYYAKLYATGDVQRIFAEEHTGLLSREERELLERRFKATDKERNPWDPNLLSCTPTLELGIDIGDLSSTILCSVPPAQANYIQRVGRAGRADGNALNITIANGRPHDLYFFADPKEMIAGRIDTPGVFLSAPAVLERQLTAFCFDRWVESGITADAIPPKIGMVLSSLEAADKKKFPYNFLAFIENKQTETFSGFTGMFKGKLDADTINLLQTFLSGDRGHKTSLAYKIVNGLHALNKERESLRKKVRILRERIKRKEQDQAKSKIYLDELMEMRQEKSALQELVKRINDKEFFNFLTDEGLIPNYAFPEAGVQLRSIIYRKKERIKEEGGSYDHWVYEYERPAVSAIHELAPASHFYAGGRKVQVDQVDMVVSEVENWRFCDNCSNLTLIGKEEETVTCPKCGSLLWADSGQKRQMLRMRQVFASTSDRESRLNDDSDDREPMFFNKQMLVSHEASHVMEAYRVDSEEFPFGFEFLSKAAFREINFGEKGDDGDLVTIAGVELPRKGFMVCRHCGKVQDRNGKPRHALSCAARDQQAEKNLTDCIYLYREFSSEAIQILLPVTTFSGSDKKLHSFVAALQLGLKRKFSGTISHLQTMTYDDPVAESNYRKRYLVLYDTVPGGTGYLKQLMQSQELLIEVFELAYNALVSCSCNQDLNKDGCYRCLFAYRNSYNMEQTSRDTAIDLLSRILENRAQFIKIDTLKNVSVNALFDSELEARFIEALRRTRQEGLAISITKEIVGGKPGYLMLIGEKTYYIEPQVKLGPKDNVSVPSKADFVLWPARSRDSVKPIAIFTDGYLYHRDRLGEDLLQRMAVARSGRYHVWSLSWKDVENRFHLQGNYYENYLDPQRTKNAGKYGAFIQGYGLAAMKDLPMLDSFEWLVRFLTEPDEVLWQRYAFLQGVLHLDAQRFSTKEAIDGWHARLQTAAPRDVCDVLDDMDQPRLHGLFEVLDEGVEQVMEHFVVAEQTAVKDCSRTGLRGVCRIFDKPDVRMKPWFEAFWNGVLRWYNLLQFIPHTYFLAGGVTPGDICYEPVEEVGMGEAGSGGDSDWVEALRFSGVWKGLLEYLQESGCPAPIPGYELADDTGEIVATAELAWPDLHIVFVSEDEKPLAGNFEDRGWTTYSLEEMGNVCDKAASILRVAKGG